MFTGNVITIARFSICFLLFACNRADRSDVSVKSDIKNGDVSWDGTYLGLRPILSEQASSVASDVSAATQDWLLANLLDDDRFVACHVILALSKGLGELDNSNGTWHGLHVDLQASGAVNYSLADKTTLHEYWMKKIGDK